MNRTLLTFIIAQLIPAIALVRDAGPAIALVYAYALTLIFGVPVFLTLKRKPPNQSSETTRENA